MPRARLTPVRGLGARLLLALAVDRGAPVRTTTCSSASGRQIRPTRPSPRCATRWPGCAGCSEPKSSSGPAAATGSTSSACRVDVDALADEVDAGAGRSIRQPAAELVDQALARVRGRPLDDVADELWAMPAAAAAAELVADAEELWADSVIACRTCRRRRHAAAPGSDRPATSGAALAAAGHRLAGAGRRTEGLRAVGEATAGARRVRPVAGVGPARARAQPRRASDEARHGRPHPGAPRSDGRPRARARRPAATGADRVDRRRAGLGEDAVAGRARRSPRGRSRCAAVRRLPAPARLRQGGCCRRSSLPRSTCRPRSMSPPDSLERWRDDEANEPVTRRASLVGRPRLVARGPPRRERAIIAVIDDAHWLDDDTIAVLLDVIGRTRDDRSMGHRQPGDRPAPRGARMRDELERGRVRVLRLARRADDRRRRRPRRSARTRAGHRATGTRWRTR